MTRAIEMRRGNFLIVLVFVVVVVFALPAVKQSGTKDDDEEDWTI